MASNTAPLLSVEGLSASFATEEGRLRAIDDIFLDVGRGEIMGLVGESGCGKSVTALSIMRLLPRPAGRIESGRVVFDGRDLMALPPEQLHEIRGQRISMIFQEPMSALNPVHPVGKQLAEVYRLHNLAEDKKSIAEKSVDLLRQVGIPDPRRRLREFPHQISGGMRQRIMIAMALAGDPDLLLADEPTTALDVTIQAQILDLIKHTQAERGLAVVLITHDLGVIAETCHRVGVMYAGRMVETAFVEDLFKHPAHPYTQGLLKSIPRLENPRKTRLNIIPGMVPALSELPPGCRFQNRCPRAEKICETQEPPLVDIAPGHSACCHFAGEGSAS